MHQAETKNAWRVMQDHSPLIDKENRTINSVKFVSSLENALGNYIKKLETNEFDSKIWKCALLKLDDIYENCKPNEL